VCLDHLVGPASGLILYARRSLGGDLPLGRGRRPDGVDEVPPASRHPSHPSHPKPVGTVSMMVVPIDNRPCPM